MNALHIVACAHFSGHNLTGGCCSGCSTLTLSMHAQVVDAGGSKNFLYALHPDQSTALSAEGGGISLSGALGKLEIRWRGNLGQLGRLQTQQIMANAANSKDVELLVISLPEVCAEPHRTTYEVQGGAPLRSRAL